MEDSAVVMADVAGVIRFWSEGAEKAFGHAADHAIGQMLDLIVPPEYREAHWIGFKRAIETGLAESEGLAGPLAVQHADGKIAAAPGRLTLVREPRGQVVGAVVVFARVSAPPSVGG